MPINFIHRWLGKSTRNQSRLRFPRRRRLRSEPLEARRVLASNLGQIEGVVFVDDDDDNAFDASEAVSNVSVELYLDDGDNVFDSGDSRLTTDVTDATGRYEFSDLATGNYFVVQTASNIGGVILDRMVSNLKPVDGDGVSGTTIDSFTTDSGPVVIAPPPSAPPARSTEEVFFIGGGETLGSQREFNVELVANVDAIDQVIAETTSGFLDVRPSAGARHVTTMVWDGNNDAAGDGLNPVGLQFGGTGIDLTSIGGTSGLGQGVVLEDVLVDQNAGRIELTIYTSAGQTSTATIPSSFFTPNMVQDIFVPFSGTRNGIGFSNGGTADFANVGAVSLRLVSESTGMNPLAFGWDLRLSNLGVVGADPVICDFENDPPAPNIDIEKFTNGAQADNATDNDIPVVLPGGQVSWQYVVTNTGLAPLFNVTVNDDVEGDIFNIVDRGNGDATLDPGESWTYQQSGTAITGIYVNKATVLGQTLGGVEVMDMDFSRYLGAAPNIDIEKFTNGFQADLESDADVPEIPVGNPVAWTYEVTNTGSVDLLDVSVQDNRIGAVSNITFQGNGNAVLEPNEVWRYRADGIADRGPYENSGTVNAVSRTGQRVDDTDFSHYVGVAPAIEIEKFTNGVQTDSPNDPRVPEVNVGELVTFTYEVRNTGNTPLANVVVRDDNGTAANTADDFNASFIGGDSNSDSTLDLTETWNYSATRIATPGLYTNIATVTAQSNGEVVDAAAPSSHRGMEIPSLFGKRRFLASTQP